MSGEAETTATEAAQTEDKPAAAAVQPPASAEEERTEEDEVWDEIEAAERGEKPAAAETGDKPDDEEPAAAAAEAAGEGDKPTAAGDEGGDKPTGQAAEGEEKDIWAEAPEPLRSAFEAERQRADRAEHGRRSAEGRSATLTRRLEAMIAGEGDPPPGERGSEAPASRQPPADDSAQDQLTQQLETLKVDYPEFAPIADAMTRLVEQRQQDRTTIQQLRQGLQTIGEDRLHTVSAEQEQVVLDKHPDFSDIADSDEFVSWAKTQPEFVQAGIIANAEQVVDGEGVVWILDRYKADRGIESGKDGGSAAGQEEPGKTKPAPDPIRTIQRRSATGTPRSSAGAAVPEQERSTTETEDDVWNEIEAEEKRKIAAAA